MQCCIKEGIKYSSTNPAYTNLEEDALRLRNIYRDLIIIAGDLEEISERHQIDGLKNIIHKEALQINENSHDIIKLANTLHDKSY
jgi:hypothetical protein